MGNGNAWKQVRKEMGKARMSGSFLVGNESPRLALDAINAIKKAKKAKRKKK